LYQRAQGVSMADRRRCQQSSLPTDDDSLPAIADLLETAEAAGQYLLE
jgi:hypothetical protein